MTYYQNIVALTTHFNQPTLVGCSASKWRKLIQRLSPENPTFPVQTGYASKLRGGRYAVDSEHLFINFLDDEYQNPAFLFSAVIGGHTVPATKLTLDVTCATASTNRGFPLSLDHFLRVMCCGFYTALTFPWRVCKIDYEFYNKGGELVVSEPQSGDRGLGAFLSAGDFGGIVCPSRSGGCNYIVYNKSYYGCFDEDVNVVRPSTSTSYRVPSDTRYYCDVAHLTESNFAGIPASSHVVFGECVLPEDGTISDHVWLAFFLFGQFIFMNADGVPTLVVFNPVGSDGDMDFDFEKKHYYHVSPYICNVVDCDSDPEAEFFDEFHPDDWEEGANIHLFCDADRVAKLSTPVHRGLYLGRVPCCCMSVFYGANNAAQPMISCSGGYSLNSFYGRFPDNVRDVELPAALAALGVCDVCFDIVNSPYSMSSPLEIGRSLLCEASLKP